MANFLFQSDSIHFFTHHTSGTVSMKYKRRNKYPYLSPIVSIFLPLPGKWGLSVLYLIVLLCGNRMAAFPPILGWMWTPILSSPGGPNRDLILAFHLGCLHYEFFYQANGHYELITSQLTTVKPSLLTMPMHSVFISSQVRLQVYAGYFLIINSTQPRVSWGELKYFLH